MRTRVLVLTTLVALVPLAEQQATAAPIPKHLMKDGGDLSKMQGRWVLTAVTLKGSEIGRVELYLEVRGARITTTGTHLDRMTTGTHLVEADGWPKRLSMKNVRNLDTEENPNGEELDMFYGYTIDRDRWVWAETEAGTPGKAMPTDPAQPGANAIVLVFTRVKDKD